MTNTSENAEEWWDRTLTSTGRGDILKAAGIRLPSKVLWRHMSPEARAAVDGMRPKEQQVPASLTPEETITQLKVENALLCGALYLAASSLKRYAEAKPSEIDDEGTKRMVMFVHEGDREKALDAIARADKLLRDSERGTGR